MSTQRYVHRNIKHLYSFPKAYVADVNVTSGVPQELYNEIQRNTHTHSASSTMITTKRREREREHLLTSKAAMNYSCVVGF